MVYYIQKAKETLRKDLSMKTFIYHGVWSYEVKAESREEADEIFHATEGAEFDHNYCDIKIEEIEEEEEKDIVSRAKELEEELISHFPSIDCEGLPATAKFITILKEMGGFDKGANLQYDFLAHDMQVKLGPDCVVYPTYGAKQVQLRCVFNPKSYPYSLIDIQPTPKNIRNFLLTHWSEIFPKENT